MNPKQRELFDLIARASEDALDPQEVARLEELLRGDEEAQQYYMVYLQTDAALRWEFGAAAERTRGADADIPWDLAEPGRRPRRRETSSVLGFLGDLGRQGWGYAADHAFVSAVALLVVLFIGPAAWIAAHRNPRGAPPAGVAESGGPGIAGRENAPNSPSPPSMVASVVRVKDCRWNGQLPSPEINQPLAAGQSLHLASGVAEIDFRIGAKVILQGPASLELLAADAARLDLGKATVEITAERARGFKVLTPDADFIDQGTEFGVEVTPGGNSKVHVFRGLVDVQLKGHEGSAAPPPYRLQANYGARIEAGESGMTVIEDGGDCYIRSMDQTERDRHVLAYWRFEDRPVGVLLPHTQVNSRPICATVDSSFNGNDLYSYWVGDAATFSADVPAPRIPQTGSPNRSSLDLTRLGMKHQLSNVYTHSQFSHAAGVDIQKVAPAQWTIEASVKAARLSAKAQGFLGRDGAFTAEAVRPPARLTFQIDALNHFAVGFFDVDGRFHEAVAEDLAVQPEHWYHLAAVSDGRSLRLYVDVLDGRGYRQRAACELPATGSTALGKGDDEAEWTIGRAGNSGADGTWLRFSGWIDEVRISDIARSPAEFLFAPRDKDEGGTRAARHESTRLPSTDSQPRTGKGGSPIFADTKIGTVPQPQETID